VRDTLATRPGSAASRPALCAAAQKTLADIVQFNHLAQRRNTVILRIQRHKPGMAAIADVNREWPWRSRQSPARSQSRQLLAGSPPARWRGIKPGMAVRLGSLASTR
jgi:hypothetical protein